MVYESYEFGRYLMELRRKDNISMSVICEGICDVSVMSRIENGEREVSKLIQDRLLGRLGVASDNYENMVFFDEYKRWKTRQEIISLIQDGNIDCANELLEKMFINDRVSERRKSVEDLDAILEMQFYLAMKAQIRRYQNADDREIKALFVDALRQTVIGFDKSQGLKDFFSNRKFSVEELNLLIEYARYLPVLKGITFLNHVINYIDKNNFTNLARAKVFPKAVYYLYLHNKKNGAISDRNIKHLLAYATRAIEDLRHALRSFYMCELLDMKMELILMSNECGINDNDLLKNKLENYNTVDENYTEKYGNTQNFSMEEQYTWCFNARKTLSEIYGRFNIKENTLDYSYIYLDMEVYCIEDVIRVRRNMLDMSMYGLCQGICSERTVSRIEKKTAKPRSAIVHKLFERLGLSGEFSRTELISSDVEMQEIFSCMRDLLNNAQSSELDNMLDKVKSHVGMALPQNRQLMFRINACNQRKKGVWNNDEFIKHVKEALELTLPYDKAVKSGEKYLTNEEVACINNILSIKSDNIEVKECFKVLCELFQGTTMRNINNNLSIYEFVMHPIASYIGDMGGYDESDEKETSILYNTLVNRRITVVSMAMYGMLWNDMQREKKNIPMRRCLDWNEEIKRCLILTNLSNKVDKYRFYVSKLKK